MKTALSMMAVVLTLGLTLGVGDAEAAKRLGGGKSSGMQRQTAVADKPAAASGQAPTAPAASNMAAKPAATAPAAAAAAQPKRSWMGPIAGLAAGLGLAALASHLGFGEGLANMLMIGLLVMAVLAVVGFILRKRAAAQRPAMAGIGGMQYAGAGAGQTAPAQRAYDVAMPAPGVGSGIGSGIGSNLAPASGIPADFDVAAFVRNAKVQFIRLQAANDAGNLDDIREFTTPEMFAEVKMDLTDRGTAAQHTEVLGVDASVIEVVEEPARYVVSVRFTGTMREDNSPVVEAFDEIWHLVKPRAGTGGWLLSGIQQVEPA